MVAIQNIAKPSLFKGGKGWGNIKNDILNYSQMNGSLKENL